MTLRPAVPPILRVDIDDLARRADDPDKVLHLCIRDLRTYLESMRKLTAGQNEDETRMHAVMKLAYEQLAKAVVLRAARRPPQPHRSREATSHDASGDHRLPPEPDADESESGDRTEGDVSIFVRVLHRLIQEEIARSIRSPSPESERSSRAIVREVQTAIVRVWEMREDFASYESSVERTVEREDRLAVEWYGKARAAARRGKARAAARRGKARAAARRGKDELARRALRHQKKHDELASRLRRRLQTERALLGRGRAATFLLSAEAELESLRTESKRPRAKDVDPFGQGAFDRIAAQIERAERHADVVDDGPGGSGD